MQTQKMMETKTQTTLEQEIRDAKRGIKVHAAVYVAVSGVLATINMLTVPQFPWFLFPLTGMGVGVAMHHFGVRSVIKKAQSQLEAQ